MMIDNTDGEIDALGTTEKYPPILNVNTLCLMVQTLQTNNAAMRDDETTMPKPRRGGY